MNYEIKIEHLSPRILAAVRKRVAPRDVPKEFKPALDKVWAFLGRNKGLRTDGHNVFLYHHENPQLMPVDFGVEVVRKFEPEGDVQCVETPSGEAAVVLHRGSYAQLFDAHSALHEWCKANGRKIGAHSLEIYGDWHSDPNKLETTIAYMLKPKD